MIRNICSGIRCMLKGVLWTFKYIFKLPKDAWWNDKGCPSLFPFLFLFLCILFSQKTLELFGIYIDKQICRITSSILSLSLALSLSACLNHLSMMFSLAFSSQRLFSFKFKVCTKQNSSKANFALNFSHFMAHTRTHTLAHTLRDNSMWFS